MGLSVEAKHSRETIFCVKYFSDVGNAVGLMDLHEVGCVCLQGWMGLAASSDLAILFDDERALGILPHDWWKQRDWGIAEIELIEWPTILTTYDKCDCEFCIW
jgi:hypothetical protein